MSEAKLIEDAPKLTKAAAAPNKMTVSVMNMTEKEYRAYPALSYSRLSDIEKVGILAVNASVASIGKLRGVVLGSVVDDVISNKMSHLPEYLVTVDKIPGPGTVTEKAIEHIVQYFSFKTLIDIHKPDLEHFLGINGYMKNGMNQSNFVEKLVNYKEFIEASKVANDETQIVTKFDKQIIIKAIRRLRSISYFSETFVNTSLVSVEFQNKFLAVINGVEIKCMLDVLRFDHHRKRIIPIDIKTGAMSQSDFESFYYQAYLKYNYYIQAGLYRKVLVEYFKSHPKYFDYEVVDFRFVYSTTNPKTGLSEGNLFIHEISKQLYLDSFRGFDYEEKGVKSCKLGIAALIKFYKDNLVA